MLVPASSEIYHENITVVLNEINRNLKKILNMKTNWLPCFTLGYGAVTGAAVKASCHAINKRWIFLGFPSPTGIAQIAILIFVFLFKKFLYLLYFYIY